MVCNGRDRLALHRIADIDGDQILPGFCENGIVLIDMEGQAGLGHFLVACGLDRVRGSRQQGLCRQRRNCAAQNGECRCTG